MKKSSVARKGGLARVLLHGNPGTPEGRRRGGLRSVAVQRKKSTGFVTLRSIPHPRVSSDLAELLGILAGDGHVGAYQITMTTNQSTDFDHALHASSLFNKLFGISAPIRFKKGKNACVVVVSSRALVLFLTKKGLVQGHKIRGGISMPPWVRRHKKYRVAFIRGLFDTDGSVYIDTHRISGREYKNIGMAFTNRSLPLLADFKQAVVLVGLHPTQKTQYTVFLRREKDIRRYFDVVGSSNPKHTRKVDRYFSSRHGGVG